MTTYPSHPMRALSPITELTTPTSLRTLRRSLEEADYEPERPQIQQDDDEASVYSNKSGDTVRQTHRSLEAEGRTGPRPTPTSPRLRTTSLSRPPPRSSLRPKPAPLPLSLSANSRPESPNGIPFPHSAPPPGGLNPPPRSFSLLNQPGRRPTPPPSPRHVQSPTDNDTIQPASPTFLHPGMAGVGAGGRSRPNSIRSRPDSFHASPSEPGSRLGSSTKGSPEAHSLPEAPSRPRLIAQHSHPTLHNIPFFPVNPNTSPRKETKTPPRSRPNSLKKRPKSYHGSSQSSMRGRPNSFHGGSPGDAAPLALTPALGLEAIVFPVQVQIDHIQPPPASLSASSLAPPANTRPPLITHRSETSLPSRSPSTKSLSTRRKSPGRRHRVSSILSSIFGTTSNSDSINGKNDAGRKLSKRSRHTSGSSATGMASKGSSEERSPVSPPFPIDNALEGEGVMSLPTAIRTSGTFGIRDDGSDIHPHSQDFPTSGTLSSPHAMDRTHSDNGSIDTRPEGSKRILFVQNGHEHDLVEEDETPQDEHKGSPSATRLPSRHVTVETVSDVDEPSVTAPPLHYHDYAHSGVQMTREISPHRANVVSPAATFSTLPHSPRSSTGSDYYGLGLLFAQRPLSTPSPTEAQHSTSHLPLPLLPTTLRHSMVDEAIQTSAMSSPTKSFQGRPLPHPPSHSASPSPNSRDVTPQPTFIAPPPPDAAPAADLPLLIASHLLSTHAAALMRHSSKMKDVSEMMHQMAKESLDWGGILMGLTERTARAQQAGQRQSGPSSFGAHQDTSTLTGVPLERREQHSTDGLTRSISATPNPYANHDVVHAPTAPLPAPVQAAYDNLTSIPPRPSVIRRASRASLRQKRGESLPADLVKEAERLGKEGWASLHAAEDAWSQAMTSLAEMIRSEQAHRKSAPSSNEDYSGRRYTPSDSDNSHRPNTDHEHGVASTLAVPRDPVISPHTANRVGMGLGSRHSAATSTYTVSPTSMYGRSTPLYLDALAASGQQFTRKELLSVVAHGGGVVPERSSFLPLEADMTSSASTTYRPQPNRTVNPMEDESNQSTIRVRPKGTHAYSNPLIRPVESPIPSSQRRQTPSPSMAIEHGYTDEQIGSASRESPAPGVGRRSLGLEMGNGTVKGSTISVQRTMSSTSGAPKKLAKGPKARSRLMSTSGSYGGDTVRGRDKGEGEGEERSKSRLSNSKGRGEGLELGSSTSSTKGSGSVSRIKGKKYWWSRS